MKIKKCKNCRNSSLLNLFSLGDLNFTGKFPKSKSTNINKAHLGLVMCKKCSLIQLNRSYNLKYLYGPDYGYKTGINKTMRDHMNSIHKMLSNKSKLNSGDYVLDIASNDATLLNFYNKNIIKVGVDPLVNKYIKCYKNVNYKVSDFFSADKLLEKKINKKFKIITALSVFYDVEDPNKFLSDIQKILSGDGIFMLEHTDLLSIVKLKMFDTICHEHLYYYSTKIIIDMVENNNLRVFNLKRNNINGGSTQYLICKKNSKYKTNYKIIKKILNEEKKLKLNKKKTYLDFFKEINNIKLKLKKLLDSLISNKKIIHGYGASTKGNVLLLYFGINQKYIKYIADRNPKKFNHYTPGTKIKIISEKKSRKLLPDYYLVLPWHFKKEILKRESKIRKKGCKFIFPLPKLKIC
jgi:hypothetical protein|tara:strand:- start:99 stop:1322 length:1224 start_codon:yes stop_codon:yes gene_type:complete